MGKNPKDSSADGASEPRLRPEQAGDQTPPKVWIILLNWDGLTDTRECLESLRQITYENYQVLVVDNASLGDDPRILGEEYGEYIHIIENDENYGFAEGNNIGIRWILPRGTDYVLLLNNDTVVHPAFLTELVRAAEADPRIGVVGSKIYYLYDPEHIWSAGGRVDWWKGTVWMIGEGDEDGPAYHATTDVDWVSGCALMVKAKVLQEISLLDPFFFLRGEDVEFCIRARRSGYRVVYVATSEIWHKVGAAGERVEARKTLSQIRKMGIHDINMLRGLFSRYASRPQLVCAWTYYLTVTLPRWTMEFIADHGGLLATLSLATRLGRETLTRATLKTDE
jgi:GT2 family glycosyltransferase